MMNVKISQNHDNVHPIRNNYALKLIYNDENECINDMLLGVSGLDGEVIFLPPDFSSNCLP